MLSVGITRTVVSQDRRCIYIGAGVSLPASVGAGAREKTEQIIGGEDSHNPEFGRDLDFHKLLNSSQMI